MNERTKELWTTGLVVVSIVAAGTAVAGMLDPGPEPELTTQPVQETQEPPQSPEEYDYVSAPVEYPVDIPGCDTVEAPGDTSSQGFAVLGGERTYDNPKFPWFSGPKATAMSDAVADLLPVGAEIAFAPVEQSLRFGPITDYGDDVPEWANGSTDASATVTNGDAQGNVRVGVQKDDTPVPPCVAGHLDERITRDDLVVDLNETWSEVNGVRTNTRSATAYVEDDTRISASATDRTNDTEQAGGTGIPLSREDLVHIVTDPRLRVSTPAPEGTPTPDEQSCTGYQEVEGPEVTREQAREVDRVLESVRVDGQALEPVQLGSYSGDTLCTSLSDVGSDASFTFTITSGQPIPVEQRPEPYSSRQETFRTLDDGTVVQTSQGYYSVVPMNDSDAEAEMRMTRSVNVTRPDGIRVSVSSTASSGTPLDLAVLESIAMTPGLDL